MLSVAGCTRGAVKLVDVLSPLRWHAGGQHLSLVTKQRNLFPKGTQASWAFEEWKRECYTRAACDRRADRRRQHVTDLPSMGQRELVLR